ncbi:MAG: hypothetical protein ABIH23_17110 [bacterium]
MDPRLASLVDLQKSMAVQRRLEKELSEIPERIESIEQRMIHVHESLEEAEKTYKEHELTLRQKEMELQESQSKEDKIQGQLFQIKTNKEYQAALQEIENFKTRRGKIEEEVIILLDTVDEESRLLKERHEEARAQEDRLKSTLEGLRKRNEQISEELESASKQAKEVAVRVKPDLLARFNRVFEGKEGVALTPANGGYCHSCQVQLTPHVVQVVQRGQDFVFCEGCSRFLYWDQELGD